MKMIYTKSAFALILSVVVVLVVAASRHNEIEAKCSRSSDPGPATNLVRGVRAEGRLVCYPGGRVEVGSEMAGLVIKLPVEENQVVEKDALVAELKSDELRAALSEAQARVNELQAEQRLAEHDLQRGRQLRESSTISQQEFERSTRDLEVIGARLVSAMATVTRLEAMLAKTRILAPIKGTVLKRSVEVGETIETSKRLATLADLTRVRIQAEVDEYDAAVVKPGQPVKVTAEGFAGLSWRGTVEEVPHEVVDKSSQPRDPARPVDVRVLLVKITLSESTPLKLGQRVEVEILTSL